MKKNKIFVISDIHGHYQETISALKEAGYDENNSNHFLICCGDCFDRGSESLSIYKWLKKLVDNKKAIWIIGNHEPMFISFLKGNTNPFNFIHNGINTTIDDFNHRTNSWEMFLFEHDGQHMYMEEAYCDFVKETSKSINKEFPELINFLENLPKYYETKNYIFTHASLDLKTSDWHYPHCYRHSYIDWDALSWDDGSFIFQNNTTNKTIVVGHFDTGHLREMWQIDSKNYNDHSILFTKDKKVFIDGCTALTKKVNVYVIEDELLEYQEYEKETQKDIDNKTEGRKQ